MRWMHWNALCRIALTSTLARKHGDINWSTASKSIREQQLPEHSVSVEIYSGTTRFPCDSTSLLVEGLGI